MADLAIANEAVCPVILRRARAVRRNLRKVGTSFAVGGNTPPHATLALPSSASALVGDIRSLTAAIAAVQDDIGEKKGATFS